MSPLHDCTTADRQRAIECAARVMETVWPKLQHNATLEIGMRAVQVIFARMPSGALRVASRDTGALIAQSTPAVLAMLDPECLPDADDLQAPEVYEKVDACITALDLLCVLAAELRRPCFRGLQAPDLANVMQVWANRMCDGD